VNSDKARDNSEIEIERVLLGFEAVRFDVWQSVPNRPWSFAKHPKLTPI
jgi:hypothetical protein